MMKVPLLDLTTQYGMLRDEIREAMDRVCESQHFILGAEVAALEQEIASYCGTAFAVGVSSGTDALLVALMALDIGPGDEVITSPFSFFATAGVIARLGARPVFVDIEESSFNIDAREIQAKITARTKAILPVHLFGRCADSEAINEIARQHGLAVIEDAAQAIGAKDQRGCCAGSTGTIGCLSFFPSKNLGAFGDAGMAVTQNSAIADTLRVLRVHGGKPKYYHGRVGGNFRLDALQAAVLRVKFKYLPLWTEARRRNAQRYRELFEHAGLLGHVTLPQDVAGHIYNQFVIRCSQRDSLQAYLRKQNIETEIYYPVPLHLQACFAELGYRRGDFLNAARAAEEVLALPIYPELSQPQQSYVVEKICEFYWRQKSEASELTSLQASSVSS
jgi:dTDP-4-amino-4,6-dideoxygalactose transaminase